MRKIGTLLWITTITSMIIAYFFAMSLRGNYKREIRERETKQQFLEALLMGEKEQTALADHMTMKYDRQKAYTDSLQLVLNTCQGSPER